MNEISIKKAHTAVRKLRLRPGEHLLVKKGCGLADTEATLEAFIEGIKDILVVNTAVFVVDDFDDLRPITDDELMAQGFVRWPRERNKEDGQQ